MVGVVVYLELGGVIGLFEVMGFEGEPRLQVGDQQVVARRDRTCQAGGVGQDQHLFVVEAAILEAVLTLVVRILVAQEPQQALLTAIAEMHMVETATVRPGVGAFQGTVQFCREAPKSLQSDVFRLIKVGVHIGAVPFDLFLILCHPVLFCGMEVSTNHVWSGYMGRSKLWRFAELLMEDDVISGAYRPNLQLRAIILYFILD